MRYYVLGAYPFYGWDEAVPHKREISARHYHLTRLDVLTDVGPFLRAQQTEPSPDEPSPPHSPMGRFGSACCACPQITMERSMDQKQPSKEQVREYMQRRQAEHCAPPDLATARRELGWDLIAAERSQQAGRR